MELMKVLSFYSSCVLFLLVWNLGRGGGFLGLECIINKQFDCVN